MSALHLQSRSRSAGSRRTRTAALVAVAAVLALVVAACSSGSSGTGSTGPVVKVSITEHSGAISADADVVHASVGQKIEFEIHTDAADEIHVHSVPDHEFEVKPGPVQTFTFSVGTPGTVEVESHGLNITILKLEIS